MDEDSRTTGAVTQRFLRGIVGLAIVASLGLAGRVHATYLHVDFAPAYAERYNAGDYLDRGWYYLLDDGQYCYLDRGQYNLLGELGYLLGHPCYPKLFERELDQAVGFTNRVNTGWLVCVVGKFQLVNMPYGVTISTREITSTGCGIIS